MKESAYTTAAPLDAIELEMIWQGVEVWRPIPSAKGWLDASSLGRIRSHRKWGATTADVRAGEPRVLKGGVGSNGYRRITVTVDGVKRLRLVQRLIAEAFYGPSKLDVDHIDHDKLDNRVLNLRYVTRSENSRDRKRTPRGYHYDHRYDGWVVQVRKDGAPRFFKRVRTEAEAARVAAAAYLELHGCAPGERVLPDDHPARLLQHEASC